MERGAVMSDCGLYRYTLERRWVPLERRPDDGAIRNGKMILWVLLNPSTADAETDDPTNTRALDFSMAWGFGACVFVNLFAWRATDPKEMLAAADPIGPDNDEHIRDQLGKADHVMVAWGVPGKHRGRDDDVLDIMASVWQRRPSCFGCNLNDTPKHPLFLPKKAQTLAWPGRWKN